MRKNFFESGSWNVICDSCGKKMKSSHAKHRWDGFIVCNDCFEHRHPQDLIKTKPDKQTVPFTRPPSDTFIEVNYIDLETGCTATTRSAMADLGTADCATVGIMTHGYL